MAWVVFKVLLESYQLPISQTQPISVLTGTALAHPVMSRRFFQLPFDFN